MEKRNRMRSSPMSKSPKPVIAALLKNSPDGKDTPHEPSSPDWGQTPKPRRPDDAYPLDFESDDENEAEDPDAPSPEKRHSADEYSHHSTPFRSQDRYFFFLVKFLLSWI